MEKWKAWTKRQSRRVNFPKNQYKYNLRMYKVPILKYSSIMVLGRHFKLMTCSVRRPNRTLTM